MKKQQQLLNPDGKLPRAILWTSANKRYVVVEGPFPYGFVRSTDADSVEKAAKRDVNDIQSRPDTTKTGRYAKVRTQDIAETHNEWGEVSP